MERAITFDDVLLIPGYNAYGSRRDVDISMEDKTRSIKLDIPIMSANMDTITESEMAIYMAQKGGIGVLHRFMSIEDNIKELAKCSNFCQPFVSVGCSDTEKERAEALINNGAGLLCVDVAHAHAKYVGKMIKWLKENFTNIIVMAGNVCTYAGADYLASKGADIIKVGVGPGSVCTTRIKTGHGVPQLTAIQECARVDRSIVADGGIRTPGDIVKALAFGADFVMVGGMLAGTHYTPGEVWDDSIVFPHGAATFPTKREKVYRGMASKETADEKLGGLTEWKTAEGVSVSVKYKDIDETNYIIQDIIGGIRSGLTYSGAANIRELQRKLNYVTITGSGIKESGAHKVG